MHDHEIQSGDEKEDWVQYWLLKRVEESDCVNILEELWLQDAQNYKKYLTKPQKILKVNIS